MNKLPELNPRLTEAKTSQNSSAVGKAADLRELYNLLKAKGAFGAKSNQTIVALRMYDAQTPEKAKNRLDNLLKGTHSLHPRELLFFKMCIAYVLGDENLANQIDTDHILKGKAHLLLNTLYEEKYQTSSKVDLGNIDPLIALQGLALNAKQRLHLNPEKDIGNHKGVMTKNQREIFPNDTGNRVFRSGDDFYLRIDDWHLTNKLTCKPLVFEYMVGGGEDPAANPYRCKFLQLAYDAKEADPADELGERGRKFHYSSFGKSVPWTLGKNTGEFGFLVIGNAGERPEDWLPEDTPLDCIDDEHLAYMYSQLTKIARQKNNLVFGVFNYSVV